MQNPMPKTHCLLRTLTFASQLAMIVLACGVSSTAFRSFAGDVPADHRAVFHQRDQMLARFEQAGASAVPEFVDALEHDHALIRRTAAHLLVRLGDPALAGIEQGLRNDDFQVRRIMMRGLAERGTFADYWSVVLLDSHPSIRGDVQRRYMEDFPLPQGEPLEAIVRRLADAYAGADRENRMHVVETIAGLTPLTDAGRDLLGTAASDPDPEIRESAFHAIQSFLTLDWPGGEALIDAAEADPVRAIRDLGLAMRTTLLSVKIHTLPADGWRFQTDPDNRGVDAGWHQPGFDDSAWRDDGRIETAWETFLDEFYIGNGWYRREIDVPAAQGWDRAILHFGGVDESGWAWLDGQALGGQDIGTLGWDLPFSLEITDWVRPGERQHVAIRARNTLGNGGVWQPVRLIFLRNWPQ